MFEVEASGDPSLKFAVNDNRNGTYDVAFTLSHTSAKIVVRHNGEHINGSPLSFLKTSQTIAYPHGHACTSPRIDAATEHHADPPRHMLGQRRIHI